MRLGGQLRGGWIVPVQLVTQTPCRGFLKWSLYFSSPCLRSCMGDGRNSTHLVYIVCSCEEQQGMCLVSEPCFCLHFWFERTCFVTLMGLPHWCPKEVCAQSEPLGEMAVDFGQTDLQGRQRLGTIRSHGATPHPDDMMRPQEERLEAPVSISPL